MRNNDHCRTGPTAPSLVCGGLGIAALLIAGLLAAHAQEATSKPPDEVRQAVAGFFEALDRLDADALGGLMTEDCVSAMPGPGGVTTIPGSDYLARIRALKAVQSRPAPERAWRDLNVKVKGAAAVMTGFTGPADPKGKLIEEAFMSMFWVRRGDRWQVAYVQRAPAGAAGEVARWNDVFRREAGFNLKPNALLAHAVRGLKPGKALDVGMGQGRNSVYLASLGWDVTGMDPAEGGLAIARQSAQQAKVRITPVLQTAEEFDWGEARWDLIAVIYMNPRRLKEQIRASLKPGGLLVVEGFHRDATKNRKIGAGVVYDTDELKNMLPEFEIVRYEEPEALPDFGPEKVRLVRLIARKKQ